KYTSFSFTCFIGNNLAKNEIKAEFCLIGKIFEDDEEILFDSYMFSIDMLKEWLGISGIDYQPDFKGNGFKVDYTNVPKIEITLDENLKFVMHFSCLVNNDSQIDFKLTSKSKIEIRAKNAL